MMLFRIREAPLHRLLSPHVRFFAPRASAALLLRLFPYVPRYRFLHQSVCCAFSPTRAHRFAGIRYGPLCRILAPLLPDTHTHPSPGHTGTAFSGNHSALYSASGTPAPVRCPSGASAADERPAVMHVARRHVCVHDDAVLPVHRTMVQPEEPIRLTFPVHEATSRVSGADFRILNGGCASGHLFYAGQRLFPCCFLSASTAACSSAKYSLMPSGRSSFTALRRLASAFKWVLSV